MPSDLEAPPRIDSCLAVLRFVLHTFPSHLILLPTLNGFQWSSNCVQNGKLDRSGVCEKPE